MEDENGFDRRKWQLLLRTELKPEQYVKVDVVEDADMFFAHIIDRDSGAVQGIQPLLDPRQSTRDLAARIGDVVAKKREDITIIPHQRR